MSYITHYAIRTIGGSPDSRQAVIDALEKVPKEEKHDFVRTDDQISFPTTFWNDGIRDVQLRDLSKKYPDVIIEIFGDGTQEYTFDIWKQRWHKGAYETCNINPDCLDDFGGILTPEEERNQFSKYATRYHKLLNVVRDLAWKHILDATGRITGKCNAELNFLHVTQRMLVITSYEDNEPSLQIAEGTIPQEKAFITATGSYVRYDDMSVKELENAVLFFDDLEKDIAKGTVKCSYDKEENRFNCYTTH